MRTRHQLPNDLEAAFGINEQYLSASRADFFRWYEETPDLFVGVFDRESLLGICYGMDWDREPEYVVLEGIATKHSHWRRGAGSLLIHFFHEQVRKRGKKRITVGVAAGLNTESFYLKNGYVPTRLCAKLSEEDLPGDYETLGYDFCEIRSTDDEVVLYVETNVRDKQLQARLENDLGANGVIFIMEKEVIEEEA